MAFWDVLIKCQKSFKINFPKGNIWRGLVSTTDLVVHFVILPQVPQQNAQLPMLSAFSFYMQIFVYFFFIHKALFPKKVRNKMLRGKKK